MRHGSRLALLLAAFASTAAGCTSILGIADSIGYENDGGADGATDTSAPDGARADGAIPDATQPGDGGILPLDAASCIDANVSVDPNNCGACGHSCLGGGCEGGACGPFALVPDAGDIPYDLAVDPVNLYWTVRGSNNDGQLYSCSVTSCVPAPLGPSGGARYGAAFGVTAIVDAGRIAFFTVVLPGDAGGQVIEDNVGTLTIFAPGLPPDLQFIASDSTNVYYATTTAIFTCPVGGSCSSTPFTQGTPGNLAAYGGLVYWIDNITGDVVYAPLDGGTTVTFGSAVGQAGGIAVDSTYVYYSDVTYGKIYESAVADASTASATTLASVSEGGATGIAVDSTYVYWTDGVAGTISRCAINGCNSGPTVLATGQGGAFGIAVDPTRVYWTIATPGGSVMSVAK